MAMKGVWNCRKTMLKNNRAVHFTSSVASKRILPLLFDLHVYYGPLIWSNICAVHTSDCGLCGYAAV